MKIKTIRSSQNLKCLRNHWERWQSHPNSDYAHFDLVCQLRPEVESPLVTVVECDDEPCALIAARLEHTHFSPRIGYFEPIKLPVKALTVIYQGALGRVDKEIGELVVQHIWGLLAAGEADIATFHHLPEDSALLEALCEHGNHLWRKKKPEWNPHWLMALPDDPELLLKKLRSKHRSWIRRKQRELEVAFPDRISWRWISQFDDIPGLFKQLEGVAARTYQRELGAGFVDDEEHRQRYSLFAQRGQLRVQLLEVDRKVQAFWIGTVYKDVFHSSETGYAPDFRIYEVGTLVFIRVLHELIREGIQTLDFGLGDALYKQRFGDRCWQEATIRLYAPTAKGMALRSSHEIFNLLDRAGRHIIQKLGALDRLKTGWRRRLAQPGAKTEEH